MLINSNFKEIKKYISIYSNHNKLESFAENLENIIKIIDKNETFRLEILIRNSNLDFENYKNFIFPYSEKSDKIIKWLYLNNYYDNILLEETFYRSCINNNIKISKWILSISKNEIDLHKDNDWLFRETCKKNSIDSVIFLCKKSKFNLKIEEKFNDEFDDEVPFHYFCRYNYIDIAKEYLKNFDFDIEYKSNEAIALSCQEGNLEMAKLSYLFGGDITVKNYWCFLVSIQRENLNIISWMASLPNFNIHLEEDYFFRVACTHGKLNSAKLIYSLGDVDIYCHNSVIFSSACLAGELDMVKWLHEIGDFNPNVENDLIFRYCCQLGQIDVLKWIYSHGNVDLHYDKDNAFRSAVLSNNNEIAKWIYSLGGVKIKSNNHEAFINSCESNNIEIAEWLAELNSEYTLEIENNFITNYFINKIVYLYGKINLSENNIENCPICYDEKSEIITDCRHQYCKRCFIDYINSKNIEYEEVPCPMCRKKEIKIYEINS